MARTTTEEAIAASQPEGFRSTFLEADRLRRLNNQNPDETLGDVVEDYEDSSINERDVINRIANSVLTSFLTPERTIELPGLALAMSDENNLLEKFAARYKQDNDTPSGTITDPERAGTDDIVFQFANPEVYSQIANGDLSGPDNWLASGLTAGETLEVIGESGIDETSNTSGESLALDDDEYLFFTGDFIDLSDGQSVITKTQWNDVDGNEFGPTDGMLETRLSGAHILTTQGTYATATVDFDTKVYDDGDAELVPIAFYMAPGTKAPGLA